MFGHGRSVYLAVLGVSVPTTAFLLYWLLKTSEDEEIEERMEMKRTKSELTTRQTVIEIKIPRKAVGGIIGRQGSVIKELQDKSGAKMNFKDDTQDEDQDRVLMIRGSTENAQMAESMVHQMLADLPVSSEDVMYVPTFALGRIIGKGGENVRQMSRSSNTKIFIDRGPDGDKSKPKLITISGTKENIEIAKSLIQEKVDEEEEFRAKATVFAANRETRKNLSQFVPKQYEKHKVQAATVSLDGQQLTFPTDKPYVEVYVSAIADPDHFWVQIINSMALELDKLSEQMTQYYNGIGKNSALKCVKRRDIVAAQFENDNTWYRARLMEVTDRDIDVFYVDYGDSAFLTIEQLRELSSEYQILPFQAIECRLHGVKPVGKVWSEECYEEFEELTSCAKWKVLQAKLESCSGDRPSVTLINTSGEEDIDIGKELVNKGVALAMEAE